MPSQSDSGPATGNDSNDRQELLRINAQLQHEIEVRRRAEALSEAEKRTLEMICAGGGLQEILESLCDAFEQFSDGGLSSILVTDEDRQLLLRDVAPNLPKAFAEAVRAVPIAAGAGTAGSAAFLKQQVIAEDIAADSKWTDYREAALAAGIRSSWSTPILSSSGRLLGVFALYYRTAKQPPKADRLLVERATHLAAIAFERHEAEERLNFLATHDPLTHLPNRHLFQVGLSKAIARARRAKSIFALLFVDLDRFKQVNDELGHACGDEVLKQVAMRMTASLRMEDTIGRLGGDEFAAVLENISRIRDAEDIAEKLTRILSGSLHICGHDVPISCSIGIAIYPQHAVESHALLRCADTAMYSAKKLGRNNFQIFEPEPDSGDTAPANLEADLRMALALDQFVLHYQPQSDATNGRIISVEALIRWTHPRLGTLLPSAFLPLAEETGLIIALGKWVVKQACLQNKRWLDAGYQVRVAVNISAKQMMDANFADFILASLQQAGLEARFLELELTENIVTQYDQQSFDNLARLKMAGVYIIVDDFGTGYSSLSYLKRLPIDGLKIDPTFTQDAATDEKAALIIDALLHLAKSLNLSVTVQGVERADQLTVLADHGCQHLQGFAISKPVSADAVTALLDKSRNGSIR